MFIDYPAFKLKPNTIFNLDDECDAYGIHMVRINDPPLAKRYGIKTYPSIVYFRNGNPLTYDGKYSLIYSTIRNVFRYIHWEA